MTPLTSVIIPTYNEEDNIEKTINSALKGLNIELIVVDGGSEDKTLSIVNKISNVKLIKSRPGRAIQQNLAAKHANGEFLLFLHGDSILPERFDKTIGDTLNIEGVIAGAFSFKLDYNSLGTRCLESLVNLRANLLGLPYGDQGIFLKKKDFSSAGGFPEHPIMEDYEFIKLLKKSGRIILVRDPVITSARRWRKLGLLKTTWINQKIILGYHLGVPQEILKKWYHQK